MISYSVTVEKTEINRTEDKTMMQKIWMDKQYLPVKLVAVHALPKL